MRHVNDWSDEQTDDPRSVSMENEVLEEQKAVIVGGTSGIGLAAAIELCRAGAEVLVTGRRADKATAAAA